MSDILIAFLITYVIACPEITIKDGAGHIRFHLEGFICMMVRTIKLQYLIDEANILIEKNNHAIKKLKEMESKKDEK
ncbi:hypothetical protein [Enterococcus diestrammenae]|uniref:Uncharacterized protein n=1 Tax=Enterococcus diestrammenae TaxID=1155073 RepID=A0ABV0F399_9ENTE|nr:hypothetical protein [Enterococcus diestrammenae]KAF1296545.1 hypothetical protein BAU18_12120 [Enterococcus diestrammenae]